jgi:hypothetical protein
LEPQNLAECLKKRTGSLKNALDPEKGLRGLRMLILARDFGREWLQEPPFPEETP